MAEYFQKYFQNLILFGVMSGIYISRTSTKYNDCDISFIYSFFTAFINLSQVVSGLCVMCNHSMNKNFVHAASIFYIYFTALLFNIYFILKRDNIKVLLSRLNKLFGLFLMEQLSGKEKYENYLLNNSKLINKIPKMVLLSIITALFINNSNKLLRRWNIFGMDGQKILNYQIPYEASYSPLYELSLLIQVFGLFVSCSQTVCVNLLFITIFFLLSTFFYHLQETISSFFIPHSKFCGNNDCKNTHNDSEIMSIKLLDSSKTTCSKMECIDVMNSSYINNSQIIDSNDVCDNIFLKWIKVHQEVHNICQEVIELYSPLLAVYFVFFYVTVAFTIFSAIQNTHSHTLVEVIILGYFTLLTLVNFYMLCAYGNYIMVESSKVSWAVYNSPWYNASEEQKKLAKIILQRAARPVVVKCFSSTSFDLSNSTFIVLLKSVVSFYLGLVQMRKQ